MVACRANVGTSATDGVHAVIGSGLERVDEEEIAEVARVRPGAARGVFHLDLVLADPHIRRHPGSNRERAGAFDEVNARSTSG